MQKTDSLYNLVIRIPDIDNIYLYGKDSYETKCHF